MRMKKLEIHHKRLNATFTVFCGKVYDTYGARLADDDPIAMSAIAHVRKKMAEVWGKMSEIDPIWGDIQAYHELEMRWLEYRQALYGPLNA